jgi:bifunctional non-homologous end joining protein LigD
VLERACALGAEDIVCKRLDAPYRAGRSRDWLKYKCLCTRPSVLGGFTAGVSTLLVGHYDSAGVLRYAGSVGAGLGFTSEFLRELYNQLVQIEQARSPFAGFEPRLVRSPWSKDRGTLARWVKPIAVMSVSYLDLTSSRELRHAWFQGFPRDIASARCGARWILMRLEVAQREASGPR